MELINRNFRENLQNIGYSLATMIACVTPYLDNLLPQISEYLAYTAFWLATVAVFASAFGAMRALHEFTKL